MKKFTAATHRRREIVNIIEEVESMLPEESGMCCLNVLHTTARHGRSGTKNLPGYAGRV